MWFEQVANFFGSLVCHQLQERTIFLDGLPLPVCARDTGIYLGIFVSIMFITVTRRWDSDKPPELRYSLLLCLATVPMMIDGVSSYLGLRESNNFLRILTGGLFGLPIPLLLAGLQNFKIYEKNIKPTIRSWSELVLLTAITFMFLVMVYRDILFPWRAISVLIIGTMLYFFYWLVLTVISFSSIIPKLYRNGAAIVLLSIILGVMYSFNRLIICPLKNLL